MKNRVLLIQTTAVHPFFGAMPTRKRKCKSCCSKIPYLSAEDAEAAAAKANAGKKPEEKRQESYECYNRRSDLPDGTRIHWHIGRRGKNTRPAPKPRKRAKRLVGRQARYAACRAA